MNIEQLIACLTHPEDPDLQVVVTKNIDDLFEVYMIWNPEKIFRGETLGDALAKLYVDSFPAQLRAKELGYE